jgi:hypothetical protein
MVEMQISRFSPQMKDSPSRIFLSSRVLGTPAAAEQNSSTQAKPSGPDAFSC